MRIDVVHGIIDGNMNKKFNIITLGCRTNQYESQGYSDQLKSVGHSQTKENADLCIVNTCTVTESADKSSKAKIRELIRKNPDAKIMVTGCLVESSKEKREEIQSLGEQIEIVSNREKEKLVQVALPEEDLPEFEIKNFDAHTRAFVKVQDGCNSYCTYCIIPYVRGRSRSRKLDEILQEIKGLIANGYKEVVLTGINIGDFDGGDGSVRLSDLIREVDQLEGLQRIRVSSIDPDEVDHDLADAILNSKKTCPSMHVVLQSGSNVILKRMNRKYTKQMFIECVERLRSANPDFTFTTDVIVGFPGETESDFEDTMDLIKQVKFAKVHMFPYSPRPRTRAALYPDRIDPVLMKERKNKLLRFAEKMAFELREQFVGREMRVLLENTDGDMIAGHTENFLRVEVLKEGFRPNEMIDVELVENTPSGLKGRVLCHHK